MSNLAALLWRFRTPRAQMVDSVEEREKGLGSERKGSERERPDAEEPALGRSRNASLPGGRVSANAAFAVTGTCREKGTERNGKKRKGTEEEEEKEGRKGKREGRK